MTRVLVTPPLRPGEFWECTRRLEPKKGTGQLCGWCESHYVASVVGRKCACGAVVASVTRTSKKSRKHS